MKEVGGWKGSRKWKSEGDKKWIIEKESVSNGSRFSSGEKQSKMHQILTWNEIQNACIYVWIIEKHIIEDVG